MLIGSLVELHFGLHSYLCFFPLEKTVLKSWLDTSLTPPRYLAICWASQAFFLSQSRQLLDTWWIDQECSCLLYSFSTPGGSIELLFLDLILCCSILARTSAVDDLFLDTCLDTSRYLICQALLKVLFKPPCAIRFSFHSISLSIALPFLSQTLLFHPNHVPQGFFKLFQVFLHLVSF